MSENHMYLVHRPSGLSAILATQYDLTWEMHGDASLLAMCLCTLFRDAEKQESPDDWALVLEDASSSPCAMQEVSNLYGRCVCSDPWDKFNRPRTAAETIKNMLDSPTMALTPGTRAVLEMAWEYAGQPNAAETKAHVASRLPPPQSETGPAAILQRLCNEINCRIEHGAESDGHLEALQDMVMRWKANPEDEST